MVSEQVFVSSFDPLSYVPIFDSNTVVVGTFLALCTMIGIKYFWKVNK